MQAHFGEIAAPDNATRFVVGVDEYSVEKEIRRDHRRYVNLYCARERRLVSRFDLEDERDALRIALAEGKHGGVLTASYPGPVCLRTLDGKRVWARRDLRKIQAVHIIPHRTLEFVVGLRADNSAYLILDPVTGETRHRIASCTRVASAVGGAYVMASRCGRAAGTWLLDPETFEPSRRVLAEEPLRIYSGPDCFLAIWFGGYAIIDFSAAVLGRGTARGTLDAAWHGAGTWIACDAHVAPNEILAIGSAGEGRVVCRLDAFAGSYRTLLAGGTMIAGSSGKVLDTSDGSVMWDFSAA